MPKVSSKSLPGQAKRAGQKIEKRKKKNLSALEQARKAMGIKPKKKPAKKKKK